MRIYNFLVCSMVAISLNAFGNESDFVSSFGVQNDGSYWDLAELPILRVRLADRFHNNVELHKELHAAFAEAGTLMKSSLQAGIWSLSSHRIGDPVNQAFLKPIEEAFLRCTAVLPVGRRALLNGLAGGRDQNEIAVAKADALALATAYAEDRCSNMQAAEWADEQFRRNMLEPALSSLLTGSPSQLYEVQYTVLRSFLFEHSQSIWRQLLTEKALKGFEEVLDAHFEPSELLRLAQARQFESFFSFALEAKDVMKPFPKKQLSKIAAQCQVSMATLFVAPFRANECLARRAGSEISFVGKTWFVSTGGAQ